MHEALSHRKAPPRVPRFVTALNRVAEQAGFTTEMRIGKFYSNSDQQHLIGIWRGPLRAFLGLKFLPPSTLGRVHSSKTISISWPKQLHPIIDGNVEVSRKGVKFELSFCTLPCAIKAKGKVEIIELRDLCGDWIIYNGTREELIATGVCEERYFPTRRMCKNGWQDSPEWQTRRYPDGSFLHWHETDKSAKDRQRKYEQEERSRAQEPNSQRDATVKSAEDYRWLLQNFMPAYSGLGPAAVSKFDGLKGADGYVYNITAESRERIEEALEELHAAIHDAEIYRRKFDARTDEEKAAARELLARAESDPAFQTFLGKLTPKS